MTTLLSRAPTSMRLMVTKSSRASVVSPIYSVPKIPSPTSPCHAARNNHETPPIPQAWSGRCGEPCLVARLESVLSGAARPRNRYVCARRSDRRGGAPDRAKAVGEARPPVLRRERGWRERQYRHRASRESPARWLHAPHHRQQSRDQSTAVRKRHVRSLQGLRSSGAGGELLVGF